MQSSPKIEKLLTEVTWKIGGQQGEGIESAGEILAGGMNASGYHLYGYRHFSSRIKGGHTNYQIRVSTQPVHAVGDVVDILVAFDQEAIALNHKEIRLGGIVLADEQFSPVLPGGGIVSLCTVPFSQIGKAAGNPQLKNVVAIGATAAIVGISPEVFAAAAARSFRNKGDVMTEQNRQAVLEGYRFMVEERAEFLGKLRLEAGDGQGRLFIMGNEAMALGALVAGARVMAAYPITPASEIMEYWIKRAPEVGGAVVQTEDEIAACMMAIGANYGGVRAFTATSGPGLSLMAEGIGLAGMTETPLVLVDCQRGGPSTGLPTKHEQSDYLAAVYGTHGDAPKIVMASDRGAESFYDMAEAFNLAEEYQCPVILMSDLQLSLGRETVEPFDYGRIEIRRGKLAMEPLPPIKQGEYFKRYQITENGLSPRTTPGMAHGVHLTTGLEHDEVGKPSEALPMRKRQMEKRLRKLATVSRRMECPIRVAASHPQPDLLVVGAGSTSGAIEEAAIRLEKEGYKINRAQIRLLHPFPAEMLGPLLTGAKRAVVVENNAGGQLARMIKMEMGWGPKLRSIMKYDGEPFRPAQIYAACKEVLG